MHIIHSGTGTIFLCMRTEERSLLRISTRRCDEVLLDGEWVSVSVPHAADAGNAVQLDVRVTFPTAEQQARVRCAEGRIAPSSCLLASESLSSSRSSTRASTWCQGIQTDA